MLCTCSMRWELVTKRKSSAKGARPNRASTSAAERFDIAHFPFHWINRVSARYYLDLEPALKAAGLDVPRWRVLIMLNQTGPASVSQIAKLAVAKLPTMTKILQRMRSDGLVVLRPSPLDARVTEVEATDAGRRSAAAVRSAGQRVYRKAFADMSDADIGRLILLLQRVFANLDR